MIELYFWKVDIISKERYFLGIIFLDKMILRGVFFYKIFYFDYK